MLSDTTRVEPLQHGQRATPLQLEAKEGLSLINGTQLMLALGVLCLDDARNLAACADVAGSMSLEALQGSSRPFDARVVVTTEMSSRADFDRYVGAQVASAVTSLDEEGPSYRGRPLVELARSATFEQVAELLWTGELPDDPVRWSAPSAADRELAAAIVDWRDSNEEVSDGGAEEETYARFNPPYRCKNAPFESVITARVFSISTSLSPLPFCPCPWPWPWRSACEASPVCAVESSGEASHGS